jgi:hypothetical protein
MSKENLNERLREATDGLLNQQPPVKKDRKDMTTGDALQEVEKWYKGSEKDVKAFLGALEKKGHTEQSRIELAEQTDQLGRATYSLTKEGFERKFEPEGGTGVAMTGRAPEARISRADITDVVVAMVSGKGIHPQNVLSTITNQIELRLKAVPQDNPRRGKRQGGKKQ